MPGYYSSSKNELDFIYYSLYNNLYRITERTFVSLLSVWFIAWGIYYPSQTLTKFSTHPIINYTGKISYGIYIYHFLAAATILKGLYAFGLKPNRFEWWVVCLNFLGTFAVAALSFEYIEKPILKLKDKYFGEKAKQPKKEELAT